MRRPVPGRCVNVATAGGRFRAFVPVPLPPQPPIVWSASLRRRFDAALVALGRLDVVTALLPNAALLLYSFVRKEAVLSSQIEGTPSSLADLLLYEIDEQPGVPVDDAREVSRCVAALERGLKKLRGGLPLCTRLLCEMHKALLTHRGGRGKTPGEVRRSRVWIGGTRPGNAVFVPPPADAVPECLASLERFLNDDPEPVPPLIKAALALVRFETIHPFLDGNGRIGRPLIVLQLVADVRAASGGQDNAGARRGRYTAGGLSRPRVRDRPGQACGPRAVPVATRGQARRPRRDPAHAAALPQPARAHRCRPAARAG
jgi:hypothetical protein